MARFFGPTCTFCSGYRSYHLSAAGSEKTWPRPYRRLLMAYSLLASGASIRYPSQNHPHQNKRPDSKLYKGRQPEQERQAVSTALFDRDTDVLRSSMDRRRNLRLRFPDVVHSRSSDRIQTVNAPFLNATNSGALVPSFRNGTCFLPQT